LTPIFALKVSKGSSILKYFNVRSVTGLLAFLLYMKHLIIFLIYFWMFLLLHVRDWVFLDEIWLNNWYLESKNRRWETSHAGSRLRHNEDMHLSLTCAPLWWRINPTSLFLVSHNSIKFTNIFSIANIVLSILTFNRVKF